MSEASEDLFEMANNYPATTGLPITVWVSPKGNARHDVQVNVNMTHGNQMNFRIPMWSPSVRSRGLSPAGSCRPMSRPSLPG
jgi:subtilisin-like proprotein convertase family protein